MRQKVDLIQHPIWQKPTSATAQEVKQTFLWSKAIVDQVLQLMWGSRAETGGMSSLQFLCMQH